MVANPTTYQWSSAAEHTKGPETERQPLLDWEFWREQGGATAWSEMLGEEDRERRVSDLRASTYCGKPFGSDDFVRLQEERFGRTWRKPGRPKKTAKSETGLGPTGTISDFSISA